MKANKKHRFLVVTFLLMCVMVAKSQDDVPSLMSYPQAPDTCSTLESRSNYVIQHFWDGLDLAKPISNDLSLLKTFRDYADVFKFAHRNVVLAGVRDFMFKLRSNSANLSKVGRIAEAVLYGPQADYWSDEVYVEFARSLASATVLKKDEREYYQRQIGRITACQEGMVLDLEFVDALTGAKRKLGEVSGANVVLVVFLDSSTDSSIDRTRLVTDVNVTKLVSDGQLAVVCVHDGEPAADWASSLPETWVKGWASGLKQLLDVRMIPSCYLVDNEHKIMNKNITVADFKAALE